MHAMRIPRGLLQFRATHTQGPSEGSRPQPHSSSVRAPCWLVLAVILAAFRDGGRPTIPGGTSGITKSSVLRHHLSRNYVAQSMVASCAHAQTNRQKELVAKTGVLGGDCQPRSTTSASEQMAALSLQSVNTVVVFWASGQAWPPCFDARASPRLRLCQPPPTFPADPGHVP